MASRNQKATLMAGAMFVLAGAIAVCAALVKPETRIIGTINGRRVDIPVWLQNEPDYAKIKNVKVENGWGWARLVLGAIALVPAGVGVALVAERRAELPEEAAKYEQEQKEKKLLGQVKTNYKVNLAATLLKKTGDAKVVIHEEEMEMKVDAYRELNGIYAPEPVRQIEPPLLREKEANGNPFEGMKTPQEYAEELKAAREAAIAKLPTDADGTNASDSGNGGTDDRKSLYQLKGKKLISSMAALRMSILSAAPTGAGKSTTMDQWLREHRRLFPKAETYVIAQKNDSFLGLAEQGRVTQFNAFSAEASFKFLDVVYTEMKRRLAEPKADRAKYDDIPVRLILDDWHATYTALKLDPNLCKIVTTKLGQIITLGREANVCLYIATQSYNLVTLGLVEDSGIRSNLAITCQGLVKLTTDEDGEVAEQGDYTVLQQLIKNQYIIPSNADRERLIAQLNELIELSMEHQVPAVFSAIGKATLGLMPFYEIEGDGGYPESTNVAVIDKNDGDELPDFTQEDVQNFRQLLQKTENSSQFEQPQNDVQNDDRMGLSGFEQSEQLKNEQPIDPELVNWYRWLPSKSEMIRLLENNDANLYNFPSFVRSKLKKSETSYNRKTKNAIVQLLITLGRNDLIEKYQIDTKIYPLSDYPNG